MLQITVVVTILLNSVSVKIRLYSHKGKTTPLPLREYVLTQLSLHVQGDLLAIMNRTTHIHRLEHVKVACLVLTYLLP